MFEVALKRAADLSKEEDAQVDSASGLAFAGESSDDLGWSDCEWFALGVLDGQIVSVVGILYREVLVGEQKVAVGGIGGVATHPDYQQRGYAGQLLERSAQFLREELKVPFGLLVCAPKRIHYYGRFGWQVMNAPMYFIHKEERRLFEGPVMILPLGEAEWPGGDVDLQGGPW